MKQGFIILGIIVIVLIIAIISHNASEVIEDNNPIKEEETIQLNEVEKVYEKYEMSNYR
jgi:hypothetical protein|tara:strand:+ start:566 stop:742 length:177 start_codon:yes stop_codon:yes gene_type:complete